MNDRIKHGLKYQCHNPKTAAAVDLIIDMVKNHYGYSDNKIALLIGVSTKTIRDARRGYITIRTVNLIRSYWKNLPISDRNKINHANPPLSPPLSLTPAQHVLRSYKANDSPT